VVGALVVMGAVVPGFSVVIGAVVTTGSTEVVSLGVGSTSGEVVTGAVVVGAVVVTGSTVTIKLPPSQLQTKATRATKRVTSKNAFKENLLSISFSYVFCVLSINMYIYYTLFNCICQHFYFILSIIK
jgi:hypothetical protein